MSRRISLGGGVAVYVGPKDLDIGTQNTATPNTSTGIPFAPVEGEPEQAPALTPPAQLALFAATRESYGD